MAASDPLPKVRQAVVDQGMARATGCLLDVQGGEMKYAKLFVSSLFPQRDLTDYGRNGWMLAEAFDGGCRYYLFVRGR